MAQLAKNISLLGRILAWLSGWDVPAWRLLLVGVATWPVMCLSYWFGYGGRIRAMLPMFWWPGLVTVNIVVLYLAGVRWRRRHTFVGRLAVILAAMPPVVFLALSLVFLAIFPVGRWCQLEWLGYVPHDLSRNAWQSAVDWRVAQWTTWWGKRLDPQTFWRGRVIWCDDSAKAAAGQRGRSYPPIPVHRPELMAGFPLSSRSHVDLVPRPFSGGLDSGPVTPYHSTDAENAYWNWFWMTKPKPPATLEREQFEVASMILRMRQPLLVRGVDIHAGVTERERARSELGKKSQAREIGVPVEALTDDALFWAYVMNQRQEYAELLAQSGRGKTLQERFLKRLAVAPELITDPLTPAQRRAADIWKIAYLQRLQREKADESYIAAYVRVWNLSPTDLAPASQEGD